MYTRHPTERTVLHAAGMATVVGLAAGEPWLALAIGGLAAALAETLRRHPSPITIAGRWQALPVENPVFRTFEGDDRNLSQDFSAGHMEGRGDVDEDSDEEEETTYADLAASLDSAEDDISFLPPYASGARPAPSEHDSLAVLWEPLPDSSLLTLLNDVLESSRKMPTHRRFALGTVAIIRNLLQPCEVEQILTEQRRYPRLRFGDIAVQLGLLSPEEIRELLDAQQEGVFTDEEILDTRARLQAVQLESERRESA